MVRAGNRDLEYSRTPVTRKTAVTPSASVTSIVLPGRSAPRRKNTAGPRVLSTWPSMTDQPTWPGGAGDRRRESSRRAGTRTEPGGARVSEGPRPAEPVAPAADLDGCGACTWEKT